MSGRAAAAWAVVALAAAAGLACDTVSQASAARAGAAGAPSSHVETVRLRDWRATLTARLDARESFSTLEGMHLRVTLRGEPVLDRDVRLPSECRDDGCTVIDDTVRMLELHDLGQDVIAAPDEDLSRRVCAILGHEDHGLLANPLDCR